MEKTCKTCANNVEYPPAHTCDVCTSLDAEEEYEMWSPKYSCITCKHDKLLATCLDCYDADTDAKWLNWTPKEEPLKGEFYVKVVCRMPDKDIEVSEIKLNDLVGKVTTDMVDSFCEAIKMK